VTAKEFLRNAQDQDEFGLAEDDGMVHGFVMHFQRDDAGVYMFSVVSALCYYGNFNGQHEHREIADASAVNCFLCVARVLER